MKSFRVALVGLGRISMRHIEALGELHIDAKIVAVAEIDEARLESAPLMEVNRYSSLDEMMINEHQVDLVSVLTESGSHYQIAKELLKWGKPVLIEKPMTLSLREGKELVEAYENSKVPLFIVKQNRLNPPIDQLLTLVRDGELGELIFVTASVLWSRNREYYLSDPWRLRRDLDGGVIWNQASHYVDLVTLIAGPIQSVFAFGANYLSPADTEDTVFALMKSAGGQLVSLEATTTVRPRNFEGSITVSGDKGLVRVGGHALNVISGSTLSLKTNEHGDVPTIDQSQVYGRSHSKLYMDVFSDLSGETRSQFRALDNLQVLAVMEGIHKSIDEAREVYISEVWGSI